MPVCTPNYFRYFYNTSDFPIFRIALGTNNLAMSMKKFRNKYRIPSARAQWWDYGWSGAYFITICTKKRVHYFGEIENKKMVLSHAGIIAEIPWHEIPRHFPFVNLGEFVVMPNHIHGILILDKPGDIDAFAGAVETGHALSLPPEPWLSLGPPTSSLPPPPPPQSPGQKRAGNQGIQTISSIVGGYKSAVTIQANRMGLKTG